MVGNTNFTISVSGALGNADALLIVAPTDPGVGTSMPTGRSVKRVNVTTQNTGAGNGWASVNIPIPDSILYHTGRTFYARWYIQDAGAANGFSVSQAVRFTIFGDSQIAIGVE